MENLMDYSAYVNSSYAIASTALSLLAVIVIARYFKAKKHAKKQ